MFKFTDAILSLSGSVFGGGINQTRCILMWTTHSQTEGATVYRGKLAWQVVCFGLPSSIISTILTLGRAWQDAAIARDNMIADLVGLRADGHANDLSDKWSGNEKKVCQIWLGNKVGSNCFKTNKYTYLKRDMLCIVQVFEPPQAKRKAKRKK